MNVKYKVLRDAAKKLKKKLKKSSTRSSPKDGTRGPSSSKSYGKRKKQPKDGTRGPSSSKSSGKREELQARRLASLRKQPEDGTRDYGSRKSFPTSHWEKIQPLDGFPVPMHPHYDPDVLYNDEDDFPHMQEHEYGALDKKRDKKRKKKMRA
tara:strand:- start:899 stop:1354 length:456 start_codon:yes stop_codon:yes gene_type:complete